MGGGARSWFPGKHTEARRKLFATIEKSGVPLAQWNHDRIGAELARQQNQKEAPMPDNMCRCGGEFADDGDGLCAS